MRHNNYKKILVEVQHGAGGQVFVPHRKPAVGKSTVVSVRLPDTMLAKLENVATQTGRTRNELVQMCIDYALARLEIPEE